MTHRDYWAWKTRSYASNGFAHAVLAARGHVPEAPARELHADLRVALRVPRQPRVALAVVAELLRRQHAADRREQVPRARDHPEPLIYGGFLAIPACKNSEIQNLDRT